MAANIVTLQAAGCNVIVDANRDCYRAQCFATARSLALRLGLPQDGYTVCFQSRLGSTPWIKPYTDLVLPELAAHGIKRLAVFCPAFVADYEALLASTGQAAPAELAARFGIDIRQPQFWRDSLAVIEQRIDRYITL